MKTRDFPSAVDWLLFAALGAILAVGFGFLRPATGQSGPTFTVTLKWTPPTQNTDGSPLTNLAGYIVYYSTAARPALCANPLAPNPGATPAQQAACSAWITAAGKVDVTSAAAAQQVLTEQQLTANTGYFFSVAAKNTPGSLSAFSNEASASTPDTRVPGAPTSVTVDIVFNAAT